MATLVIDRVTLPVELSSLFASPRIVVQQRQDFGEAVFSPVIDPNDFDNDTDYLNAIPGMAEKIIEGNKIPSSECVSVEDFWADV